MIEAYEEDDLTIVDDFVKVDELISSHVEQRVESNLDKIRRRQELVNLDLESYRNIVMHMEKKKEQIYDDMQVFACDWLEMTPKKFEQSFKVAMAEEESRANFIA